MATANHVLLQRVTLTANAASVTFNSIPQTGYTDLKIVISARDDRGGVTTDGMRASFNGSTTGFTYRGLAGSGSAASSYTGTNSIGLTTSATATANTFSNCEVYIPNYTSSNYKSYTVDSVSENNATTVYMESQAGLWSNTAAITSITFSADTSLGATAILAGSTFSLYGIADVNTTPKSSPKAFGGDVIKTDGTYWYHAFTSSSLFTPQINLTADILVVAGGGGGASDGGGGGAGGLLGFTSQSLLSSNSYTCIVGAGGAPTTTWVSNGAPWVAANGNDSQFGSLTLVKGGGGGASFQTGSVGATGGSGGGGGINGVVGTSGYVSGQGNAGGSGTSDGLSTPRGGGGGGGASVAGGNGGASSNGGSGGNGSSAYSSWGSVTGLGQNVSGTYYFAGGGGGGVIVGTGGAGGYGGGGAGQSTSGGNYVGAAGSPATGGGGAGSGYNNGITAGGAGGSGVIIIRYPV